ncbi:molecular chaperone [uncultured Lutibacter sp.]|uniref:molecular chaperone n=1 Tax=uncultured Lutibacter sp. TaxID=437739 RepID=UPI00262CB360|nr:molecular chaperone [uncultured Lutibacter sp.]
MVKQVYDSFFNSIFLKYILLLFFLVATARPILAQGDLLIYPKRVIFGGSNNIEKLTLANTGKDTAIYNISFIEYKMNQKGELKIISAAEEGLQLASSNIRFFPRKVTLPPNESQIVKVQLRKSQDLLDGEYRSHLYFRAEEKRVPLGMMNKKKDSSFSVKLKPVFGISIPCIIRKGVNTTTVSISDLQLVKENDKYNVLFNLNRNGNMSAYGDFTVNYVSSNNTNYEVAILKGVGVYTPGNLRKMKLKLNKPENVTFDGGLFNVVFTENESKKVLATASLSL